MTMYTPMLTTPTGTTEWSAAATLFFTSTGPEQPSLI